MTTFDTGSPAPAVWGHNLEFADQILECIEDGTYCALLGPRFWGKSNLLQYVMQWMQEHSLPCVHINLFEIQAPTQADFFFGLAAVIAGKVSNISGRPISIPVEEFSSAVFRDFLSQCVDQLGTNLTVIFDHLEGLPADLNNALLTSLRALHMEQQDKDLRFIAVVSGALSLAARTVGETSPFHGIARRLIMGDLDLADSEVLVNAHTASENVHVSASAKSLLLEETRGIPNLIKLICRRSVQVAAENPSRQLTAQTVNRVVREFLRVDASSYGPLQEAVRLVEEDPDLLQCILKLLKSELVPRRELPLPIVPDLDPLYLTGLVERVEAGYRIRNGIYRRYLAGYFDAARAGYLLTLSGRWDAAIGHLEESVLAGNEQSRTDLLAATVSAMYASETPGQAAYYILRGLSAGFGVSQISIWLLNQDGKMLSLLAQKGTTFEGVLPVGAQEISTQADRIEARSFRQVCLLREIQDDTCTRYVIPLMVPGQPPVGVVTLADCGREETVTEYRRREFQLQSYLNQSGRALHEVESQQKREEKASQQDAQLEKQTRQLFLLHRVSTLTQTLDNLEKVSHLVLTAITAHFGLGFNRAWLFLMDSEKNCLAGRMAVGSLTEEQAYQTWSSLPTFDEYVDGLQQNQMNVSAIDPATREMSFPISTSGIELFSITVAQHRTFRWMSSPEHWHSLPQEFRQTFEPGDMILTPLVVHNYCLGLIAVDNKFRPRLFTDIDELLLKSFANQLATAIFNIRQHEQEMQRLRLEQTLRNTSLMIGSSLNRREVLKRILEEMKKVLLFDSASIQLLDAEAQSLRIFADDGFEDPEKVETLSFPLNGRYPNVLVFQRRQPLHFDDVQEQFPHFKDPYYQATHIRGWLGAPLISNDQVIGVITLDSKTPGIYTSEHDRLAVLFASQASVAIENARLYETEKETREYLDLLVRSSQDGIIAVNNAGRIILYSEGAEKILCYTREEVGERRVDELYGSLKVAREINKMLNLFGMLRDYETTILDRKKNPIPILLSASLLRDKSNQPIGSVGFFKDLRPLRKVENNLRVILDTVSIMSGMEHSESGLLALAERLVTVQPVTFCSILLLEEGGQSLVVKATYPNPRPSGSTVRWDPVIGRRIPMEKSGITSSLAYLPEPHVFKQQQMIDEQNVIDYIRKSLSVHDEIQSALIVPLRAGNEVLGICVLGEARSWERSPFDEEKVELVSSMVTQGTVFVDRLQAHEATRNKLVMVERLRSIGDDLIAASSGSATSILDKVVQVAKEVTGASSVIIYPWDKQLRNYDTDKIVHIGLTSEKKFSDKTRKEDGSMTSIVLRKRLVIVDDIQKGYDRFGQVRIWARPGSLLDREGVRAYVGISLRSKKDEFGVLFVNFSEPHYFSDSELDAINLFANQAVIAIENARLYEDLDRRLEESETLQKVGIFLSETRDEIMILDRVMQAAFDLIQAESGNFLFFDAGRDEFEEQALTSSGRGQPLQEYQTRVRQRQGYSYQMIKNGKPIRIYDTRLDPAINPVMIQKKRRGVLGVPLIGRENRVGVLWLYWKNPRRVTDQEETLLMALAGQAAVVIENIRLFQQRNEESQALQKIGVSLTEPMKLEKVLHQVLLAALDLVDGDETTILLYDERRDEFDTEALSCTGPDLSLQKYETKARQRAGLAYQIVHDKTPIFISDALLDGRISKVAIEKGRRAIVGVPLLDHEGPVGVLWVNWRQPRQVSSREGNLLIALASQATVAIKGVRRYEELQRRSSHLEAVHEAGKVISAASVGLGTQQVLDRILEEAIESITDVSGQKASFGTISLIEEDVNELVVKSVYPSQSPQLSLDRFERIPVDPQRPHPGRIGISGRAILTRKAQLVLDVSQDADYIVQDEKTKSELVIPLLDDDKVIGVMDVESDELNAFDELDQEALTLLADLAVVALRNARQASELTRSNAVGLMGAWGAEVVHVVNREVGYIRREVFLIRQDPEITDDVRESLTIIDQSAEKLALPEIPERLPGYEAMVSPASCRLDATIKSAMEIYGSGQPEIKISFEQGCGARRIAMHEKFLYSIVRNLLRNAGFALSQISTGKVIRLRSRVEDSMAIFEIQDSGPGVPPEIIPDLFRRLIPQGDGRKGRGLLLVGFIVNQHDGRIEIVPTPRGEGAFFRLWLPLAAPPENDGQPG
jgi:PAS domain S-box-containing protein